ncbi:hypothetical protein [Xenorhabdus bovienii]|uniref:hypothetical protein n=1 Tax=Xenorhabdus bovienii TaxID=40576 RepID=UPI001EDCADDD|nr:hypothetical protein [Xenorhabdus bovienii]MCG3461578.1 hypothetical protein [Xenorhabdus bovienii]
MLNTFVIVSQQTRNNKFCTDCSGVSGTAFFVCPTKLANPQEGMEQRSITGIVARFKQGNTETPLRRMSAGTTDINGYPPLP